MHIITSSNQLPTILSTLPNIKAEMPLINFSSKYILVNTQVEMSDKSKESPREHLPEDDNPNKKSQPVKDPEENKKKQVEKEDYTSEGEERYIKQPTRSLDDAYLPGEDDDLVEED